MQCGKTVKENLASWMTLWFAPFLERSAEGCVRRNASRYCVARDEAELRNFERD